MKWDCDGKIDLLFLEAKEKIRNHIEMLYIQAMSKSFLNQTNDTVKIINEKLIDEYLKKRGYTMNYILNKKVMVKGFTCISVKNNYIEVWHDKTNNDKSVFISESLLTGLPITLNYMERI